MEWKTFAFSVVVAVVLVGGLGFYQQGLLSDLQASVKQQIADVQVTQSQLSSKISDLSSSIDSTKAELQGLISDVEEDVQKVQVHSEQTLSTLSGQLQMTQQAQQEQFEQVQQDIADINVQSTDFSDIAAKALDSIVSIITDKGAGSGAFFETGGYIVTNAHVIEGASQGAVKTSDGKFHAINIVGKNVQRDIAVIRIPETYPSLGWANSQSVEVGQRVIALGSPAGLDFTVTEGIISATDRVIDGNKFLQHDVPINPGNSGGPLLNSRMQIVGINTKKVSGTEGLGFALTSNLAKVAVDEIMAS